MMSGPNTEYVNITNTRLHGAWMWHKSAETRKWNPVWSVLRDNVLFFFSSEKTCLENHVGTLHLNKDCSFHYGDGSPKDGYKFELQIAKKKKKFKVKTVYERELWRAYMEGVITGTVPHGVVLSPQDTLEITNKLRFVRYYSPPDMQSSAPALPPAHSQSTPDFGQHTRNADSVSGSPACEVPRATSQRRPSLPSLTSTTTGSSSSGGEFDPPGNDSLNDLSIQSRDSGRSSDYFDGGPFMRHRFTTEGDGKPPSWFFHDCSRELAEKILTQCHHMGNTLMRVSWTARNTGSYAISKRLEWSGNISHYEVVRVAEGYRINAENCNKALKTLSDVMDFFIQLSGPTTTHPMSNNDLQQLGIDYTDYSRRIVKPPEDVPPVPSPIDSDSDGGENYEIPSEPPGKLLPSAPPAPVAPPAPALVPPASLAPGSPGLKPASNTWGRDKREAATRQTHTQGGGVAKTLGPSGSDWRSSRADSMKPSAMSVNQTMQERDVVENLDAVLRREEKSSALRGSATPSDIPPPLPPVPESRPKLDAQGNPIYENKREPRCVSQAAPPEGGAVHHRWNHRSQSVPNVVFPGLDTNVLATASPPSMVRQNDVGGKIPPLTFPKTPRVHHLSISEENKDTVMDGAKGPGMSVVQELQQKLQLGNALKRVTPRAGPAAVQLPSRADSRQQEGEMYEDIGQYYQNCP